MPVSLSRDTIAGCRGRRLILGSDQVSCMNHIWGCYLRSRDSPCPTWYVSAGWDSESVGSRRPIVLRPSRARTQLCFLTSILYLPELLKESHRNANQRNTLKESLQNSQRTRLGSCMQERCPIMLQNWPVRHSFNTSQHHTQLLVAPKLPALKATVALAVVTLPTPSPVTPSFCIFYCSCLFVLLTLNLKSCWVHAMGMPMSCAHVLAATGTGIKCLAILDFKVRSISTTHQYSKS